MNLLRVDPLTPFDLPWVTRSTVRAPWRAMAMVRFALADAVGLGVILVSAYQASHQDDMQDALSWLCAAAVGLMISGAAAFAWISSARLAVATRRARLDDAISECVAELQNRQSTGVTAVDRTTLLHVARTQRFHRGDCALVADRKATAGTRAAFVGRKLVACEVCNP